MGTTAAVVVALLLSPITAQWIGVDSSAGTDPADCYCDDPPDVSHDGYKMYYSLDCAFEAAASFADYTVTILRDGTYAVESPITVFHPIVLRVSDRVIDEVRIHASGPGIGSHLFNVAGGYFEIQGAHFLHIDALGLAFSLAESSTVNVMETNFEKEGDDTGIILDRNVTFICHDCSFSGGNSLSNGGAMRISGNASVTLTDSVFFSNTASGDGGAIYMEGPNASLVGTDLYFQGCSAGGFGGGIAFENVPEIELDTFLFLTNMGAVGGGAIASSTPIRLLLTFTILDGNLGAQQGGIYLPSGSELVMRDCELSNHADDYAVFCADPDILFIDSENLVSYDNSATFSPNCLSSLCQQCTASADLREDCVPTSEENWNAINVSCRCPPGQRSVFTPTHECQECPMNTYSNREECLPCPALSSSPPSSTSRDNCTCAPRHVFGSSGCEAAPCLGNPCTAGGDVDAVCVEVFAPVSNNCTCSPAYTESGGLLRTCQACPEGCSSCSDNATCTACFDANAEASTGRCVCSAGYYQRPGESCSACAVAIPGCSRCSSAEVCLECGVGELSEDDKCVTGSSSTSSATTTTTEAAAAATTTTTTTTGSSGPAATTVVDESEGAESSDSVLIGVFATLGVCMCLVFAVIVLAVSSRRSKKASKKRKRQSLGPDATVQLDTGTFGAYIQEQIDKSKAFAHGGFGAVYKIKLQNGNEVALKVLDDAATETAKAEFHRESMVLTKLTTLNSMLIVPMACFCESPVCLGMEYATGGTLADVVKKGPASGFDLVKLAIDSAAPLQLLHEHGYAHLDVKPHNYLVMNDRRVVICDFGLTMEVTEPFACTTGTPTYLAPERFYHVKSLEAASTSAPETDSGVSDVQAFVPMGDPRACDVFSWGIMLSAFATGEFPYWRLDATNVPLLIAEKDMRPSYPKGTPKWVVELSTSTWCKFPSDRLSIEDVMERLDGMGVAGEQTVQLAKEPALASTESGLGSMALMSGNFEDVAAVPSVNLNSNVVDSTNGDGKSINVSSATLV